MVKQEMLGQERWEFIERKKERLQTFLDEPTRDNLLDLVENLWATLPRGDKEHLVDEMMLEEKTPSEVATIIQELFERQRGIDEVDVKGIGLATSSELLHAHNPEMYAILNRRSRHAMSSLGYYVSRNNVTHDEYIRFCEGVMEATQEYGLDEAVRQTVEQYDELEHPPESSTLLEVADYAFHLYAEGYIDLERVKTQKEGIDYVEVPEEVLEEIEAAVEQEPTYRDKQDFVLSAIRNELKSLR